MFENVGLIGSAGIAVGLLVACSIMPTIAVQVFGRKWRGGKAV